ncbi:hypothetical protein ACHAW6_001627 [Cyclotella cf. meneghiniana]
MITGLFSLPSRSMKLFSATALASILFAQEGAAQTRRLRNQDLYKSAGSQRQLQPGTDNIFDGAANSTTETFSSTEFSVVIPSISLSLPPILTPPILTIPTTAPSTTSLVVPTEPIVDVSLSMSAPGATAFPDTIPAIDTTVPPTGTPVQSTALPQVPPTNDFGVPEDIASISMSFSVITEPASVATTTTSATTTAATTTAATTTAATTTAASTTIGAAASTSTMATTSQSPSSTTEMCMSMDVTTIPTELPPGGEEEGPMSIPQSTELSAPPVDFIPPIEESAPTAMPTSWFNKGVDSSSSAPTGKSCVTTIAAVTAAGLYMLL